MATMHPVSGYLTPGELKALVDAPYGAAAEVIRRHDPMWGRTAGKGEKIKWKVNLTQQVTMVGSVVVEAESEEEAERLAEKIPDLDIMWDFDSADVSEIESVEPAS